MKIKLLISLALAFTVYVGAMTSENDSCSCQINRDFGQTSADTAQLSDSRQGYIFDRNSDGWIVNSCPGYIFYGFVDVYGDAKKLMKLRRSKYTTLKSPWEKSPNSFGIKRYIKLNDSYIKLNGNSNNKQTSQPEDSIPWWIQSCQS